MTETRVSDTKDHIMEVAEGLFAEQGVAATSLRSIMAAADVNPAAIHYHFGGKQALLEAVLARRLEPLNAERLERLEALEAAPKDLAALVEAFVGPALRLSADPERGRPFVRLLGRIYSEAGDEARSLLERRFRPTILRFADALRRHVPDVDPVAFAWRVHFVVGAMAHAMSCPQPVAWLSDEAAFQDAGGAIDELVAFVVAGLTAPAGRARS